MAVPIQRRRFSTSDYARMREIGILKEDDRVELLAGEVREMSPIGPQHAAIVKRLNALLTRALGETAIVSVQDPIQLDDFSEPQPDLAILRPQSDFYANRHPQPDEVILVIEVADSSIDYDRTEKLPRYAAANIPEVWIVDIGAQTVEQHTQPRARGYRTVHVLEPGETLIAAALANVALSVEQIIGLEPLP